MDTLIESYKELSKIGDSNKIDQGSTLASKVTPL